MDAGLLGLMLLATLLLASWAARHARSAILNFGPNDVEYVSGFREDWERDRLTRFHWTTRHAVVRLPLIARGEGLRVSLRARRHLVEPARVTLRESDGQVLGTFDIQADPHVAYRVVSFDLPPREARSPFVLTIDSSSPDVRPLGVALDWMEVERISSSARFALRTPTLLLLLLAVALAYVAPRLAGASAAVATVHAALVAVAAAIGVWWDIVAAERIVREGAGVYAAVGVVAVALARGTRTRRVFDIVPPAVSGALVTIVLAALALRLVVLLHPQFYYPDVKVHALFSWQLARRGLVAFLRDFTENQFRYSLGLQMENGHWYAFPYPPLFYVLTWPLVTLARMRPEVAVSVLAAAVNSLEVFLVYAIARRLRAAEWTAVAAAGALAVLPLFLARLSLAYFPALVGHAVDAVVILFLLARLRELDRPRVVLVLGGLIALALLTYTQSLLNFAVLIPLVLVVLIASDRSPETWRRAAGLFAAGALGGVLSLVLFYGRYVPTFLDMQRGIPMAEERILQEKPRSPVPEEELAPQEPDDPFAGPTFEPWRGVRKAAWRLYVFYGPFALCVAFGLILVWRAQEVPHSAFVLAWALTYLVLNLLSAGLPGPNLVRYNKDLEVVAPLFCLAVAAFGEWLWARARVLAWIYGASFLAFGLLRAARYLTEKLILER